MKLGAARVRWPWMILVVVGVGLTIACAHRAGDFAGYVLVGELGLAGRDVYRDAPPNINTWPPVFALLCMPLALGARLSLLGTRMVWLLVNGVALVCALAAAVRLVYGRALLIARAPTGPGNGIAIGSRAVLLPLLFCLCWILLNFGHLQINILLFALTLSGLTLHRRGRDIRAGLLIGVAAACKVMPLLFVPYFVWRRQWRVALCTGAATLGWSLVPAAVYGWPAYLDQLGAWRHVVRTAWSVGKMNLSVYAMWDRVLGHGLVPFTVPGVNGLPASGARSVTLATAGSRVLVTLLGLWWFRGPYNPRARTTVAEWSTVCLVAPLFGPVAWKAYLIVLLLPMTLFVATWRDPHVAPPFRRRLQTLTWLTFAPGLATASDLVGQRLAWRLEMGSLLTLMALLILGMLLWYRVRLPSAMGRMAPDTP